MYNGIDFEEKFEKALQGRGFNGEILQNLIKEYSPYISKVPWSNIHYRPYHFAEDIKNAYNEGISALEWFAQAKNLENTLQDPNPDSDFFKTKELFKSMGVSFDATKEEPRKGIMLSFSAEGDDAIYISDYYFDNEGKFIKIRIRE